MTPSRPDRGPWSCRHCVVHAEERNRMRIQAQLSTQGRSGRCGRIRRRVGYMRIYSLKSPHGALRSSLHGSNTTSCEPVLTAHRFPSCFDAEGCASPDYPGVELYCSLCLIRISCHISTTPSSVFEGAQFFKRVCHALAPTKDCMTPRMLMFSSGCSSLFGLRRVHRSRNRIGSGRAANLPCYSCVVVFVLCF
ncbi:hypothetical protein C8R45DRAFT_72402 [Mycena sanguinolenta]|nr:hypothetical protein C8R45DRAFT_72402 [Mycena sanguinolenta]